MMKTLDNCIGFEQRTSKEKSIDQTCCKISEVADINIENINEQNFNFECIQYVDISSVEKGFIVDENFINLNDAPTRAKRMIRDNDILISTVRPNLKHYVFIKKARENMVASTGFAVVRARKIVPRYLYYFLTTQIYTSFLTQIAETHAGTYPSFKPDIISDTLISIPEKNEQLSLVAILGPLDDRIELNRQINSTLESLASALFHSWFVKFDPFLDGEFVESELGLIPKGWEVKSIKESCKDVFNGGTPYRKEPLYWENGHIKWIKSQELLDTIITDAEESINEEGLKNSAAKIFGKDTILIALYGATVGQLAISRVTASSNQAITAMIIDITKSKPFIIFYSLLKGRRYLKSISTGAAQQNISKKIIEDFLVIAPPSEILEQIAEHFDTIWNKIENNIRESLLLSSLRDLLLPQLLSGRLRIKNPKQFLEELE